MTGCLTMLGRLGRDNAGNTLAIAAASLLPLMALIGGGVDISRSYMAKTELQSACDAGVLAGRKAMSKTGKYETAEKAKATSMFNFNFSGDKFGAKDLTYVTSSNADGEVLGTATVTVPTLVMKIFDKDQVALSVDCMAELQIGNVDVMFVLDNTTSMLYAPDDVNLTGTQYTVNDSRSRFYALKEAVKDFHKTINTSVTDTRTRIRYGFVPYAMTVNVAGLLSSGQMPTSYISDVTDYQTRRAMFDKAIYVANSPTTANTTETYSSNITQANCSTNTNNYGNNKWPTNVGTPVSGGGPAPTATTVTSYTYLSWTKVSGNGNSALGTCKRTKSVATTTYATWWEFTGWKYGSDEVSTSNYRNRTATRYATAVTTSTAVGATSRSKNRSTTGYDMVELAALSQSGDVTGVTTTTTNGTWSGCIEERASETPSASYDFDPIPSTAYDMQFDTVPTNKATRWKPQWYTMYIKPASWSNYYFKQSDGKFYQSSGLTGTNVNAPPTISNPTPYCVPGEMKLFDTQYATLSTDKTAIPTALTNYLATLGPGMYTYHDIGMIWGGRLTSPTGLFASNVNLDADKINVSKHLIFMTDGMLDPEEDEYSAYGIENYDHRIAPSGSESQSYNRHMARFVATCEAIKAQGTTIWVVAFGTSMTTQLQGCATGGRAYYSSNTTALRNTFKYIASQVADLRLGA